MGYGAAADDERVLSYSSKELMGVAATAPPPAPPPSVGSAGTTPPSGVSPTANPHALSPNPPGMAAHTSRIAAYARQTWRERRPWREFYSTRAVSVPKFVDLSDRFASNLHVYRANYQIIAVAWLLLLLLGSLHSLLLAAASFWAMERYSSWRAEKSGGTLPHKTKAIVGFAALLVIWLTGLGSYAARSLVASSITVAAHASFHEPQADETEIATV